MSLKEVGTSVVILESDCRIISYGFCRLKRVLIETMTSASDTLQNAAKEQSEQLPVPKYMRTHSARPRYIASAIILLWLSTFYYGVKHLTTSNHGSTTFVDDIMKVGQKHWVLTSKLQPEGLCVGYMKTSLAKEPLANINLEGKFAINVLKQLIPVTLNAYIEFSSAMELASFRGEFSTTVANITVTNNRHSPYNALLTVSSASLNQEIPIPLPSPIFLLESGPETYVIRLPEGNEHAMPDLALRFSNSELFRIFKISETSREDYQECVTNFATKNKDLGTQAPSLDFGQIVNKFGFNLPSQ
jgi:hypothetical protein